jgi:hypothetical protein
MREELRAPSSAWATVQEKRMPDQRLVRVVQWRAAGRKIEIETSGESRLQLVAAPGILFYSPEHGASTSVLRCDVATGARREVANTSAPLFQWSASEDGYKLLLLEQGNEGRVRVLDATRGTLLHGPWNADSAVWMSGVSGRYITATLGRRHVIIDTLRDRVLETGFDSWPWAVALADGRFVVEDDREIRLFDGDFQFVRTLFRAPTSPEVAAR